MAEQTILVCDTCRQPATQTVSLKVGTRTLLKDLCKTHLAELVAGTRRPKRGRRPGSKSTTKSAAASRAAKGAKGRTRRRAAAPAAEATPAA